MILKEIQTFLFLFKKIQISFKTWKNGIEIAFAYTNYSKIIDLIASFSKKSIKWIFILLFMTFSFVAIFHFKEQIKQSFSEIVIKKQALNVFYINKNELMKNIFNKQKALSTKVDAPITALKVESTFVKLPIEKDTIKPIIKKFEIIPNQDTSDYFIIVANKAFKTLYLLQMQNHSWRVVKEYDIAIGEQEGKKVFAGDKRTPEGQYFIVGRKEYSELSSIYGPLAYVLNYPNEEDRKAGRTGQGIWIHGTDPDSVPIETKGCLEMKNEELRDLSKYIKRGIGVPVLIVNNKQLTDPAVVPDFKMCDRERKVVLNNYDNVKVQFDRFLTKWKIAWETKNIVEYGTYYDTLQFNSQGLDWNGWKERKLRTFGLYDTIAVTIDNIVITDFSDQEITVKFYQRYKTNLNMNENVKKLSLEKVDTFWKITSESTCLKEELLL
jgi:hypothetical protein